MGLFKKIFGGSTPEKDMFTLLQGPSTEMANEMERVYRSHVSMFEEDHTDTVVSGRGVAKARLFGVTFMVAPFLKKWQEVKLTEEFMEASSGLAMLPFNDAGYHPALDTKEAKTFAGKYTLDVFNAINSELKDGPSAAINTSEGFEQLVDLYKEALIESIGQNRYSTEVHERFYPMIAGAIFANLKHMNEWRNAL